MFDFRMIILKSKYQYNIKLCYVDTDSFMIHFKTEDVYEDIVDDAEKKFDTLNYEVNRPVSTGKNKKSDWINERLIRRKIYDRVCGT